MTERNFDESFRSSAFPKTRWSLVIFAGSSKDFGSRALSELCETYWYPIFAYLRRFHSKFDAEDLTQGFFESLLRREDFSRIEMKRGKFRTFLLSALQNYRTGQIRREMAQKRGGGEQIVPIDFSEAEQLYLRDYSDDLTPDIQFEIQFASALYERSIGRLKDYYRGRRKDDVLTELLPCLAPNDGDKPFSEVAANLGCSIGAARKAAHGVRLKFKECFRAEVFDTVRDFSEVDDEIRHLISLLGERRSTAI